MKTVKYYRCPLGWVEIQTSCNAVTSVVLCNEKKDDVYTGDSPIAAECINQLDEYFNGARTSFDLPISQTGTVFQQSVWNVLTEIEYGTTVSYSWVAKKINNPKSVRAVGAANGKNKIWIIVPCHRVIGADGSLTGYAGGLERKKWLLAHEGKHKI